MVSDTSGKNQHSEDVQQERLPTPSSVVSHHEAVYAAGKHPTIDMDIEYDDIAGGLDDAVHVTHGDRLIGMMERGECPTCGHRGTLSVGHSFGSAKYVASNTSDGFNWTLKELKEDGYRPIYCSGKDDDGWRRTFLVGIAEPEAVEEWDDWQDNRDEIVSVQKRAVQLAEDPDSLTRNGIRGLAPRKKTNLPLESKYSHGDLIAAIYHALGCTGYDPRELVGRSHATKKHLGAILTRLWSLDVSPRRDLSEREWADIEKFGNKHGKVQWKIPSWVENEGLFAKHRYKRGTYDGVMVDDKRIPEVDDGGI